MLKNKKFIIAGAIAVVALSYLAFTGFQSSATYYYTVSEFAGQEASLQGQNVKINGQVAPGSVQQEPGRVVEFSIVEGGKDLSVVYQGTVPDTFQEGIEVVVQGHLNSEGVFRASEIMTKCPSKYVPET